MKVEKLILKDKDLAGGVNPMEIKLQGEEKERGFITITLI